MGSFNGSASSNLGGAAHPGAKVPSADPVAVYWTGVQRSLDRQRSALPGRQRRPVRKNRPLGRVAKRTRARGFNIE